MPKLKQIQETLAANVKRLRLTFAPEGARGMNGFAKHCKIGNSALEAIEDAKGDPQLSTLVKISAKLGLEPWHLFVPEIDPDHKPHLLTQKEMEWHLKVEAVAEARPKTLTRPSR